MLEMIWFLAFAIIMWQVVSYNVRTARITKQLKTAGKDEFGGLLASGETQVKFLRYVMRREYLDLNSELVAEMDDYRQRTISSLVITLISLVCGVGVLIALQING